MAIYAGLDVSDKQTHICVGNPGTAYLFAAKRRRSFGSGHEQSLGVEWERLEAAGSVEIRRPHILRIDDDRIDRQILGSQERPIDCVGEKHFADAFATVPFVTGEATDRPLRPSFETDGMSGRPRTRAPTGLFAVRLRCVTR